jgi:DNA-binding NtrC family response regulator
MYKLLVIDDDPLVIQAVKLSVPSHWVVYGGSKIHQIPDVRFHAALVDMHLQSGSDKADGLKVISHLATHHPNLEIIAMSGALGRELMEASLEAGASRFLAKPLSSEEINLVLSKIEALMLLHGAQVRSSSSNQTIWVGDSDVSKTFKQKISFLRGENGFILIEGEIGSGKEVAARLINQIETDRSFLSVNVAAIPENLFDSEIFGHVKGAFTGADFNKVGLTEAAHGGDLFFDEIEALSLQNQAKLLRFLETGEVRKVGSKESIYVKVRILSASNISIADMVKNGQFREDLMYRLAGKKIHTPALRERIDDIESISRFFLEKERPRRNKELAPDAIQALQAHSWPGNVRELKRIIEQASLVSKLPIIREEDILNVLKPVARNRIESEETVDFSLGLNKLVELYEKRVILQAFKVTQDVEKLADMLTVSRSSMYKKIKDYQIEDAN